MTPPIRVLVLCTGNSARSQMAEALIQTMGKGRFLAESAGSQPAPRVNPHAMRVLAEAGIDWSGRTPRAVADLDLSGWDLVITVCNDAQEACPVFPGGTVTAHWGQPDPAAVTGTDGERLAAFREALATLRRRVDRLLALPLTREGLSGFWEVIGRIGRG